MVQVVAGAVYSMGAWQGALRDGLGLIETAAEIESLAASVPDAGGVVFVPALAGVWTARACADRYPPSRPDALADLLPTLGDRYCPRCHVASGGKRSDASPSHRTCEPRYCPRCPRDRYCPRCPRGPRPPKTAFGGAAGAPRRPARAGPAAACARRTQKVLACLRIPAEACAPQSLRLLACPRMPADARACSCKYPPDAKAAAPSASDIFEAVAVGAPISSPSEQLPRTTTYTFDVGRVMKGTATGTVKITTNLSSAACGAGALMFFPRRLPHARRGVTSFGRRDGTAHRSPLDHFPVLCRPGLGIAKSLLVAGRHYHVKLGRLLRQQYALVRPHEVARGRMRRPSRRRA